MPIKSEQEYEAALKRVEGLMGATEGTPEIEELERLTLAVVEYEDKHYHIEEPTPEALARFRQEQEG